MSAWWQSPGPPPPTSQKWRPDALRTVSHPGPPAASRENDTWPALLRFPFRIAADTRRPPAAGHAVREGTGHFR